VAKNNFNFHLFSLVFIYIYLSTYLFICLFTYYFIFILIIYLYIYLYIYFILINFLFFISLFLTFVAPATTTGLGFLSPAGHHRPLQLPINLCTSINPVQTKSASKPQSALPLPHLHRHHGIHQPVLQANLHPQFATPKPIPQSSPSAPPHNSSRQRASITQTITVTNNQFHLYRPCLPAMQFTTHSKHSPLP
jgi:hypothetical protein